MRNQKEIPTPNTEVGKNQTNNQAENIDTQDISKSIEARAFIFGTLIGAEK